MGLHYHEAERRRVGPWLLALLFVIAASVLIWLAMFRVPAARVAEGAAQTQAPARTVVVPGPAAPSQGGEAVPGP